MNKTFLKIGHRGNGAGYGENTLQWMNLGSLAGANCFEYDVRMTKDRHIVLIHDETVDRTTNGKGKVCDYTYDELHHFNAGYRDCVPRLEDVFRHFEHLFHNIELKEPIGKEVLQLVRKYGLADNVLVSSFNWDDLSVFRQTTIATALIADQDTIMELGEAGFLAEALQRGASAVNPHYLAVTHSFVLSAHDCGLKVFPWTVNAPDDISFLKRWGVDGIISDFPERL